MAKPTNTTGVINAPKPKPAKPKASPKSFAWPLKPTDEEKKNFAASLQELLPPVEWTHTNLAEALWGRDNFSARNIGKAREWIRGERIPTEVEAGYVAQVLEVSMQRLLQPTAPFDPNAGGLVRGRDAQAPPVATKLEKKKPGPQPKNAKNHTNGHDPDDRRWILPDGIEQPAVKLETYKERTGFIMVDIKGAMPAQVARAIMLMAECKPENE